MYMHGKIEIESRSERAKKRNTSGAKIKYLGEQNNKMNIGCILWQASERAWEGGRDKKKAEWDTTEPDWLEMGKKMCWFRNVPMKINWYARTHDDYTKIRYCGLKAIFAKTVKSIIKKNDLCVLVYSVRVCMCVRLRV